MSIGPSKKEPTGFSTYNRIHNVVQQTTRSYFKEPIHYLFYLGLPALIVSLLFGYTVRVELYFILGIIGLAELYQHYDRE